MKLRYKQPFFSWLAQLFQKVSGIPPLALQRARAGGLTRLTAYGGLKLQAKGVPVGYTAVDWVSNNAATLVPTGVVIRDGEIFEIEITCTTVTGSFYLFQARDTTGAAQYAGPITGISGSVTDLTILLCAGYNTTTVVASEMNRQGTERYHMLGSCTSDMLTFTVENLSTGNTNTVSTSFTSGLTGRPATEMCLFGNKAAVIESGTPNRLHGGCKVEFAKLKINGTYVLDLKPVTRDSDGTPGFINLVDGTFLTATEGSLNAGPVTEIIPTPDAPADLVCNNGILRVLDKSSWTIFTNPTSIAGQGVYISPTGLWYAVNDRGAGCAIPLVVGTSYILSIHKHTATLGTMLRYGQSPQAAPTAQSVQLVDWYRGGSPVDGQVISFTAKLPYLVMQLSADAVEAGMIQEAVEVIEASGDQETLKISTKNLFNADLLLGSRPTYYKKEPNGEWTARVQDYSAWTTVYNSSYLTLNPGKYTLSSTKSSTLLQYSDSDGTSHISSLEPGVYYSLPKTFTITEPVQFNIKLRSSTTYPNNLGKLQLELNASATTYVDYNNSTATAEYLLKLGDYVDSQDILNGIVSRKLGVRVFKDNENVGWSSDASGGYCRFGYDITGTPTNNIILCSHFVQGTSAAVQLNRISWRSSYAGFLVKSNNTTSSENFKQWLADQYNNGTPVIIVYQLIQETTETVPPQPMSVVDGDNTLEIVQASLTGLELAAEYKRH